MPHPKVKIADNSGNEVAVTSNALDVNIAGAASIDIGDVQILGYSVVTHGAVNVTDSAVQLGSATVKHVDIMANISNTGIVYIGASGVSATTGIGLYPGDVYSVDIDDTDLLYVISTVSGDDINVVMFR